MSAPGCRRRCAGCYVHPRSDIMSRLRIGIVGLGMAVTDSVAGAV
jgi:hypothetical protein